MANDHHHHAAGDNGKGVATAFFLNLAFTVVEIIGGFWTGSIAILSDALHDLGDSLSLGVAWYFQRLSRKGRTPNFTYGYKRFNTLGAIITGVVLVAGSVLILTRAVPALWDPGEPEAEGMIYLAILGVVVNGAAAFRVRKGGDSLNERVISWHLLEDVLGWVAVLVGSIIMYFYDLPWIDPALSIGITLYILYGVVQQLWKAGKIIVQAAPEGLDYSDIEQRLKSVAGVTDAHHLHLWTLDGQYHLASAHLVVEDATSVADLRELKERARSVLHEAGVEHATLEFETEEEWAGHRPDTPDV
ncbi:cobalt-zinc-cadmium efflux system protein [Lewinella marina]|uniref:Cation transporter n=1 Tax=Neolewinella marina TaxID=438751 RepID=A0A2G0CHP7_9BACT|nr:cation diffusion facilitator family transporter [Neolewinella marina]NJB86074.1 cobalt-zinc-cadmium efflux system protein [Neolewinella marina]PHK99447.1 cation transporter [Neolewinella marina]